ncbi:uncharacterized protein LOC109837660 [Asparagus officinalis]|uniref:uncharacterized protein LOC109837660 n=1 Tax=Asparagus officinalis TaxID=4686 RepID=UPI00098E6F3E|nr:uncharacterized protein LOC109837660 [Asparagus officinalis]
MAKKFENEFLKNEPKRIRVCCRYKETYGCPWMLFAAPVKNDKRMEIKRFVNEHSCGQHSNLSGQSRASRKFIAAQLRPVLKARSEIRPIDVQKDFLTRFGLRLEYSKIWWGRERAQQDMYGDSYEAYDQLRLSGIVVQGFLNGCRPLLFLDRTFLKDRYKGMLLSAIAYDGDQGIFPLASKLKDLGMKAKDTQVLGNLLQTACYKYTIAEWNDYMKEIYEMAPVAYEIAINYSPEHWANAVFPGIRYGHVTSNVAESFNNWIREARLLRILQMVEHIRKQLMTCMNNRRIMACKWTSYLCPKAEQIVRENMEKRAHFRD